MTAPIRSMADRCEPYRIVLDYEALVDGFLDRIEDLNTTLSSIDAAGGFADGNAQKLLTKIGGPTKRDNGNTTNRYAPRKRTFGWESLGKMLKGTGLALVLVVDDERFAPMKEQLMQRRRPKMHPNGSMKRPEWLFTPKRSQKMQLLRNERLSPQQRRRIAKKAAKARWRKRKSEEAGNADGAADRSSSASNSFNVCREKLESAGV